MKRVTLVLTLILCLVLSVILVSCGGKTNTKKSKYVSVDGFSFDGTTFSITVSNAVDEFSFLQIIKLKKGAAWQICTDKYGTNPSITKIVPLSAGDNTFYLFVLSQTGEMIVSYPVSIRRKPIYTVTFDTDGGTEVDAVQIEEGDILPAPTDPTRRGYSFAGWDVDLSLPVMDDLTVTAQWLEMDKWETIRTSYAEKDRSLKIQLSDYGDAEKTSRNDIYLAGPDKVDGQTTKVERMVYERNTAANQALGTTVKYIYWNDLGWGEQADGILRCTESTDPDAPDLFVDMLYDLNKVLFRSSVFGNIWSTSYSCFDFTSDGWKTQWMRSLSLTGNSSFVDWYCSFFLGGDYFIDLYRSMGVLPFNATLMDENASKLAPALFGESLAEGETMSQRFINCVENGQWTWDVMSKLCEAIWADKDQNGEATFDDTLGFMASSYIGYEASVILYSTDDRVDKFSPDLGFYKFFKGKGIYVETAQPNPYSKYDLKFARDELLFSVPSLLGTLEGTIFQEMKSVYSVVPIPSAKNTVVHNSADVGAINAKITPEKAVVLSGYIQYCTEHSGEIRDELLKTAVRYKTPYYQEGSDRVLNLICENVNTDYGMLLDCSIDCLEGGRPYRLTSFVRNDRFGIAPQSSLESFMNARQPLIQEAKTKWATQP